MSVTSLRDLIREKHDQRRELPQPSERRALRKAVGATTGEVAQAVGVTAQAVSLWERGLREPQGDNLGRYLEVLALFRQELADL